MALPRSPFKRQLINKKTVKKALWWIGGLAITITVLTVYVLPEYNVWRTARAEVATLSMDSTKLYQREQHLKTLKNKVTIQQKEIGATFSDHGAFNLGNLTDYLLKESANYSGLKLSTGFSLERKPINGEYEVYNQKGGLERVKKVVYWEIPIQISLRGRYRDIQDFMKKIEGYEPEAEIRNWDLHLVGIPGDNQKTPLQSGGTSSFAWVDTKNANLNVTKPARLNLVQVVTGVASNPMVQADFQIVFFRQNVDNLPGQSIQKTESSDTGEPIIITVTKSDPFSPPVTVNLEPATQKPPKTVMPIHSLPQNLTPAVIPPINPSTPNPSPQP